VIYVIILFAYTVQISLISHIVSTNMCNTLLLSSDVKQVIEYKNSLSFCDFSKINKKLINKKSNIVTHPLDLTES